MKKASIITVAALAATLAAMLAGCAGQQEYDRGMRLYQLRQYDDAIGFVEEAVRSDPNNEKYRELLVRIKQDAARAEYQRGLQFLDRRQLDQALIAFDKARTYNPASKEAENAYNVVRQRRENVQSAIESARQLLAAGRPDEAIEKLDGVESLSAHSAERDNLKVQALAASTIMHTRQGAAYMQEGRFEEARKEFFIALNRTPNYRPAAEGMAAAEAQLKAAELVERGAALLEANRYEEAQLCFQQAINVVPNHKGAIDGLIATNARWARALYDEGRLLEEAGDFDSVAEALRRYERAGALTEGFGDLGERVKRLKGMLAPEYLRRAEQYEQLGADYLGLALINYRMALYADPSQMAVSRKVAEIKEQFDRRRAFYIDIRSADHSSAAASFSKQLAQRLMETALSSGINDLVVVAPLEAVGGSSMSPGMGGMPGRRLTILTSLLSEQVTHEGRNKPEIVRSRYRLGTRSVPNPLYQEGERALARVQARQTEVEQDYRDALARLRMVDDPDERVSSNAEVEYERRRLNDAQNNVTAARLALADISREVEQEIIQPYDYKVYSVLMEAAVEVSLMAADPDTGAVRVLEVITGTSVAKDTYNENVSATDVTGVTPNPEELPTESELMAAARKAAAEQSVAWLQKTLGQLSIRYYQRAKELEEIGNTEGAAEYFYAFYQSTPLRTSPEVLEALAFLRKHTHLITPEEIRQVRPSR